MNNIKYIMACLFLIFQVQLADATSPEAPLDPLQARLIIETSPSANSSEEDRIVIEGKALIGYFSKSKTLKGYGISCGKPQFPGDSWHFTLITPTFERVDLPFEWINGKIRFLNNCGFCFKLKNGKNLSFQLEIESKLDSALE